MFPARSVDDSEYPSPQVFAFCGLSLKQAC